MKKKICVVTGSRAEFGLLLPIIKKIESDEGLELKLAVTGSHLSIKYGETYKEIVQQGIPIDVKIEIIQDGDNAIDINRAIAKAVVGFGEYFSKEKPDIAVILGDRYEMLGVATAALISQVPIAHIHGGEITEGAIDDSIRHAITKLSHLHFTSCEVYRGRVIQLGEHPDRVFNVGALGIENIKSIDVLPKKELEKSIDFTLGDSFALVTYHPVTLESNQVEKQVNNLMEALETTAGMKILFTKANADSGGIIINSMIDDFVDKHREKAIAFHSLGLIRYLSAMKYCSLVIGNSSSGIIEAPSFNVPTINIGERQKGRIQAESVINCIPDKNDIIQAIHKATDPDFLCSVQKASNPYGDGDVSNKIVSALKEFLESRNLNLKKEFFDIKFRVI